VVSLQHACLIFDPLAVDSAVQSVIRIEPNPHCQYRFSSTDRVTYVPSSISISPTTNRRDIS